MRYAGFICASSSVWCPDGLYGAVVASYGGREACSKGDCSGCREKCIVWKRQEEKKIWLDVQVYMNEEDKISWLWEPVNWKYVYGQCEGPQKQSVPTFVDMTLYDAKLLKGLVQARYKRLDECRYNESM